jgi:GTPase
MFVDKVSLTLKAGDGGNGKLSFRQEKFIDRGGPDGGDGGRGGNVVLLASWNQNTLSAFRYKKSISADNGIAGDKRKKHGRNAGDLIIKLPVGTTVSIGQDIVADLSADKQEVIIARGGGGGFGNAHFVSSTRQAPRIAEKGEKGEQVEVIFELKMLADVGLIGLPNAGKSTLLSVISNAKPEIANYPFTTLIPNLGVVDIDNTHTLLVADIPGLIEGASKGKGLGDEFLRHVERTSLLVHLIDIYQPNITEAYKTIIKELREYKLDLSLKPQIIVLTKVEATAEKELKAAMKKVQKLAPKGTQVLAISSSTQLGIKELLRLMQKRVALEQKKTDAKKKADEPNIPIITIKPKEEDWTVEKADKHFVITGKKIERFAQRTHFDDFHGQQRFRDIMKKMRITAELEKQGIEPGQKIQIGSPEIARLEY